MDIIVVTNGNPWPGVCRWRGRWYGINWRKSWAVPDSVQYLVGSVCVRFPDYMNITQTVGSSSRRRVINSCNAYLLRRCPWGTILVGEIGKLSWSVCRVKCVSYVRISNRINSYRAFPRAIASWRAWYGNCRWPAYSIIYGIIDLPSIWVCIRIPG